MKTLYAKLVEQYQGLFDSIKLYWKAYGGFCSLITSPYLHISIIISVVAGPLWLCTKDSTWYQISLSALPNLLGFTLGGYAILLAFGDDKFRENISVKESDETTLFMTVNGAFIHFIVVQTLAIIAAVIGSSWNFKNGIFAWLGFTLFIYSILTAVAAAMAVLEMADLFEIVSNYAKKKRDK
jgi:hypothetical protein